MIALSGREWHPVLSDKPEGVEWPPETETAFYEARREAMALMQSDPLRHGYEPPVWALADKHLDELRSVFPKGVVHLFISGGNRAAKSERAAKRVVEALIKKAGARWWCADATEAASRANQQRLIWKYLPVEWRNETTGALKRTKTTKIKYSVAGGFTENIFVLPNGSECEFKFYEQKTGSLQAVELDGFWGDELLPLDWIETIEYRLVNRDGIFHLTFTPVEGYTQTVAYYLDDAKTIEEVDAELLPVHDEEGNVSRYERVPRVLQCKKPNARVIFFHTSDNPYGNYSGMKELAKVKGRKEILMRVYGVTSKTAHVQFPMFRDTVHVLSMNKFGELEKKNPGATRYHLVDPCSGRNWFMLWIMCVTPQSWIVYREWPSTGHPGAYVQGIGDPGEWAMPGDAHDGEKGPAQNPFGFGLTRYREEILKIENGETIFQRWIDSRYGNSPLTEREGSTTLVQQMHDLDMDFLAAVAEKSILNSNDGSIDMINSALYYDESVPLGSFSPSLARINQPQLLVTENCPNTIWALKNWTGKDGGHGACKDPIDDIRMCFLSELDHVSADMLQPRNAWMKQFSR